LLSGGGNRYDYWRIAWRVWQEHPVLGVGAGNYERSYYAQRATSEDIQQPHSLELQTLSELGVVGGLLLVGFLAGIGWGTLRMRRLVARSRFTGALMVGGLGALSAWLVQTSVDWMHLLPGLTAIAIAGAAVLIRPQVAAETAPATKATEDAVTEAIGAHTQSPRRRRVLTSRTARALRLSAVFATLVIAGGSLSRQGLADFFRARAQREHDLRPAAALADANSSLDIDSDATQTYYVKAAALARFGEAEAAVATLRQALAREPRNFVTWALLGDISVREGRLTAARRDYGRAHALNPRNATLAWLAAHPAATSH
jgi:Flp pilus assembly protein TadD